VSRKLFITSALAVAMCAAEPLADDKMKDIPADKK
jgi:hypothetical protein